MNPNGITIPRRWRRLGLVIPRVENGDKTSVAGDPCIVWDEDLPGWRMVLFFEPPGHAQAVCRTPEDVGPGRWEFLGPLAFANPADLVGKGTHKPFIVMEAHRPNRAARVDGRYWLLLVNYERGHKLVQSAWAEKLAGPWRLEAGALIEPGPAGAFDERHVDAVTGYYFPEREAFLYFYMGYPEAAQPWPSSPYGSAQGAALQPARGGQVEKLGVILPPEGRAGHWAGGWVGGLQILPGRDRPWIAVANASPTAPRRDDASISREEPPPSLGGFAVCAQGWPVSGWSWQLEPVEWVAEMPPEALAGGEGANLWRQHLLCLPSGRRVLFYNSGPYGREQLFAKEGE